MCVTVIFSGSIVSTVPAVAAPGYCVGVVADEPSGDWLWVRYLASAHPYSTVRAAAWSALISSAPEQAIAEFLASGYDYAVSLAEERRQRNLDFIRRVYETTTAGYSPELHARAQRLLGVDGRHAGRE